MVAMIFRQYDIAGKGFIDETDIKHIFMQFNEKYDVNFMEKILSNCGKGMNEKKIYQEDFYRIMTEYSNF